MCRSRRTSLQALGNPRRLFFLFILLLTTVDACLSEVNFTPVCQACEKATLLLSSTLICRLCGIPNTRNSLKKTGFLRPSPKLTYPYGKFLRDWSATACHLG